MPENEINIRIWRCAECGTIHMDCPALGSRNNTDWAFEDLEDAVGYLFDVVDTGAFVLDDNGQ